VKRTIAKKVCGGSLISGSVGSVEKALRDRVEPRLVGIENRLAAIGTRLDVADRLAKLEAEVIILKSTRWCKLKPIAEGCGDGGCLLLGCSSRLGL
jgi:hypothetical protein